MSKDPGKFIENIQKDLQKFISEKYKADLVFSNPKNQTSSSTPHKKNTSNFKFDMKPVQLQNYLKKYIIGQEKAINTISTKVCTHFNRMVYEKKYNLKSIIGNIKPNILMIGPTGVGKTYIIKLIADKLGVPFVKGDATKFTETGYVGGDIEDLIRELVKQANDNISLAEYGIVYLDEIDKIASSSKSYGPDISRSGVQRNLLKVMEESEVSLRNPMDIVSQMENAIKIQKTGKAESEKVNTKNILFIMSGAFQSLHEIVQKRLRAQQLGFKKDYTHPSDIANILEHVTTQDLIDFGFESEFVGRLPVISVLHELSEKQLFHILKNPKSNVIISKKRDFLSYGIKIHFQDSALQKIASISFQQKTGARSLTSVLENILISFENYLPSFSISDLVVSPELVDHPNQALQYLLTLDSVQSFSQDFYKKHSIQLEFPKDSILFIQKKAKEKNIPPLDFIKHCLGNYGYGLKLIGKYQFEVTPQLLKNHQEYLDNLIKNSYN